MMRIFVPDPPQVKTENTCPECKDVSPIGLWRECEVGCEDCGSHVGGICPLCDEVIDTVYHDIEVP